MKHSASSTRASTPSIKQDVPRKRYWDEVGLKYVGRPWLRKDQDANTPPSATREAWRKRNAARSERLKLAREYGRQRKLKYLQTLQQIGKGAELHLPHEVEPAPPKKRGRKPKAKPSVLGFTGGFRFVCGCCGHVTEFEGVLASGMKGKVTLKK